MGDGSDGLVVVPDESQDGYLPLNWDSVFEAAFAAFTVRHRCMNRRFSRWTWMPKETRN